MNESSLRPLTPTEKDALLSFIEDLRVVSRSIQWDGGVVNENSLAIFEVQGTRERLASLYDASHNLPYLFSSQAVNVHLILRNIELALNSDPQAVEYSSYVQKLASKMNFILPLRHELLKARLSFSWLP